MTYTLPKYRSYQDYLDDEQLSSEKNYRLLSTGELVEVSGEDDGNLRIANRLLFAIVAAQGQIYIELARNGNKEIQVPPVGDKQINRKPDLLVMREEHLSEAKQAIQFGMRPPLFVAEIVSSGGKSSDNYQRDYVWKRQQYEWWQIPEYWIIDPHRVQITVLALTENGYRDTLYEGDRAIASKVFPALKTSANALLTDSIPQ